MGTALSVEDGIIELFSVDKKVAELAASSISWDWSKEPPVEKCFEKTTEVVTIDHQKKSNPPRGKPIPSKQN
jgi:hypothetical protein